MKDLSLQENLLIGVNCACFWLLWRSRKKEYENLVQLCKMGKTQIGYSVNSIQIRKNHSKDCNKLEGEITSTEDEITNREKKRAR